MLYDALGNLKNIVALLPKNVEKVSEPFCANRPKFQALFQAQINKLLGKIKNFDILNPKRVICNYPSTRMYRKVFQNDCLMFKRNYDCFNSIFFYQTWIIVFKTHQKIPKKSNIQTEITRKVIKIPPKKLFHVKIQTFSYRIEYSSYLNLKTPILIFRRVWAHCGTGRTYRI